MKSLASKLLESVSKKKVNENSLGDYDFSKPHKKVSNYMFLYEENNTVRIAVIGADKEVTEVPVMKKDIPALVKVLQEYQG